MRMQSSRTTWIEVSRNNQAICVSGHKRFQTLVLFGVKVFQLWKVMRISRFFLGYHMMEVRSYQVQWNHFKIQFQTQFFHLKNEPSLKIVRCTSASSDTLVDWIWTTAAKFRKDRNFPFFVDISVSNKQLSCKQFRGKSKMFTGNCDWMMRVQQWKITEK